MSLILYFSGSAGYGANHTNLAEPELILKSKANLMLSYWLIQVKKQDQHFRFPSLCEARKMAKKKLNLDEDQLEIGCESHFLDSGSFTLWTRAAEYAKETGKGKWSFYDTPEFWEYMDAYAAFVKKYKIGIDYYANVDVIPEPVLSWRNLKYLEDKHQLTPVPVVHYTTDLKWLQKHMDAGYKFIALGGLVGSSAKEECRLWLDKAFQMVCDTPDRKPKVKIHGFGVTNYTLLLRYPWYSVDSTSWTKVGAYGGILVPHRRGGQFIFNEQPYLVKVSHDSPDRKQFNRHFLTMSKAEQAVIMSWLDSIGIPFGSNHPDGEIKEYGVLNRHSERKAANLLFFEQLRHSLPEWPWPFGVTKRTGLFSRDKR